MPKKAVIIGATGFIGRALMCEFERGGIKVHGFSRRDCDFLKRDEVLRVIAPTLEGATMIYAAGKHRQYGDTLDLYESNNAAVINLLYAAESFQPEKIIFLSSIEVYGVIKKSAQITAHLDPSPTSLYAAGKIAQEYLIRTWAHRKQIPCSMLRLPGIYGLGDNETSIISLLFSKALSGDVFELHTDGGEVRDYVSAVELAACVVDLVAQEKIPEVLNIGSGVSTSMNRLIELVALAAGRPIKISQKKPAASSFDVNIDASLLKNTLTNWPVLPIELGVERYIDEFEKYKKQQ
jgi:UDP-glucose 4-epimerase